jgi:DNA-binding IclR family transcriptional regulator
MSKPSKPKSEYMIQTVSNALRLLEVFYDEPELGVSELSRRLGLHKNNVFRLLATLELGGYMEQSASNDRYRLGVRCLELGRAYSRSHTLVERARPALGKLVENLGETAHLGVLREFEVVHLDGIQSSRLLVTASRVGQRLPVHCSALGKVLMGCAAAATRERYDALVVSGGALEALTPATVVDGAKLFEQLRTVGGLGYALDISECEEGLNCAAAPVYDENGEVLAALSVSGPSFRVTEDVLYSKVVPMLTSVTKELSSALGFQS